VNSSYLDYGNYSGQLGIFYYDPRILTLDWFYFVYFVF
jgi:hypothetical protein